MSRVSADEYPGVAAEHPPGSPILQVQDLSVEYTLERGIILAVDRVSLEVGRGEFTGIVGESACGKSTLLFAIAQLLVPPAVVTGSDVIFKGRSMAGLTDSDLAAIRWQDLSVVVQSAMNAPADRLIVMYARRQGGRRHGGLPVKRSRAAVETCPDTALSARLHLGLPLWT